MAGVGGPTVDPEHLTTLAAACRDTECVRFDYRSRDGTPTRRDVEPHSLVTSGDAGTSSAGTAAAKAGGRSASTASAVPPQPARGSRAPPRLPTDDAAAYVQRSIAGASGADTRRASPSTPRPRWWRPGCRSTRARSSRSTSTPCTYRGSEENLEWLAIRIAMLGAEVEVHEPPELAEALQQLADRLARAAQTGGVP